MVQFKVPKKSQLVDQQFLRIEGPDGLQTGYRFDAETCTLYAKEADIIIPSFHGQTHIAEDPVPNATTDTPGLMSASDKAKLDAVTQTRVGILGFNGAGFPDDGGFLSGDIILAAGTEFISIERIGNVVRFTVDSPLPLNCGCEECAQIFWIQDESDVAAVRPPSCAGKMPGVNVYGELKIYQFPESTILNPSDPVPTLNKKGNFPALIFKRYDDAVTPGQAEFELILSRNSNGTTNVGWAFTPGANGVPQAVWFMGLDDDGNQIRFDLDIEADPDLLGSILYKGHTLTRQMAVVTGFTASILSTNQYNCRFWSINTAQPKGDEFVATNVWKYNNPENSPADILAPRQLVVDATCDILPVGTLVQIWEFQIGAVNGERLVQRFFSRVPKLNPATLWNLSSVIRFGDLLEARAELIGVAPTEITAHETNISDIRLFERTMWGITNFDDRLILADDGTLPASTDEGQMIRSDSVANIEPNGDPDGNPTPNFIIAVQGALGGGVGAFFPNELVDKCLIFTSGNLNNVEFNILENSVSRITLFDPDGRVGELLTTDTFDIFVNSKTGEPSGVAINNQYVADIDPNIPGLRVFETAPQSDQERPVWIWHRQNHKNVYIKALVGRPDNSRFPPIDILLKAPIDNVDDHYMKVIRRGTYETGPFQGNEFIVIKGVHWKDLPPSGTLRILTGVWRNYTWNYQFKAAFDSQDDDGVVLIGFLDRFPFDVDAVPEVEGTGATDLTGGAGTNATELEQALAQTVPDDTTVAELEHQDYTSPALRLEFSVNDNTGAESLQLQFKGGILDMNEAYNLNVEDDFSDDFVRDFRPGSVSVSKIMTQDGFFFFGNENLPSDPEAFKVFEGGTLPAELNGETELWNELEIMYRDGELWVWWNKLLINPDPAESAKLPTPVAITTPYFQVPSLNEVGKIGFRLFPGAIIREIEIRDQSFGFNEFTRGQLELTAEA